MDVTPLVKEGHQIIQSYSGGVFRISSKIYETPVIVTPETTIEWKTIRSVSDLKEADFEGLIRNCDSLDVVLLGCGAKTEFLPPDLKSSLKDKGLTVDVMDTGAACRTYNVLMAEGRRVAAALLPV